MKLHKRWFLFLLICITACNSNTVETPAIDTTKLLKTHEIINNLQETNPLATLDISPMDMSYFPPNYQQMRMSDTIKGGPVLRVIYSRPHLQGRKLFQDFLKYGQPWRLGANESTELDVFEPIIVQGRKLPKGRYTLYCIPKEDEWIIAINSNVDVWGLKIDSTKDVMRVKAPVSRNNPAIEYFTIVFEKADGRNGSLVMGWQDIIARLAFKY